MLKRNSFIIGLICILALFGCSKNEIISLNDSNETLEETTNSESVSEEVSVIVNNDDSRYDDLFSIEYYTMTDEEEIDGNMVLFQEAKYPEITSKYDFDDKSLDNYLTELNDNFKKSAESFIADNKQDSREVFEFRGYDDGHYEHDESLNIERFNGGVLSILSNCYEYMMGAHGSTIITGYNYNWIDGKKIIFDELISDKTKLKELIVNYLENEFKEEINEDYKDTIDSFLSGEYEMRFLVTDNGIDIIFNQYDIAAYAVGIITVPIDYVGNEDVFSNNLWLTH